MRIVVLPGDGIGPEIAAATSNVLRAASERFGLNLQLEEHPVGHASLQQFGATVRRGLLETVQSADGLILGPTATADFKDERDGEINPSRFFRKNLDLFANVRPARTIRDCATASAPSTLSWCGRIPRVFMPTAIWNKATASSSLRRM
jgi:3-isopropylmalate dehydrogenase